MTYPTDNTPLEANKSNLTAQTNDHPDHHNELATAVNAIVGRLLDYNGGRLVSIGTSRSVGGLPTALITGPYNVADRHPDKLAGMLGMIAVSYATSGAVLSHDETTATMGGGGWCELLHKIVRRKPNQHQQGAGVTGGPMNLSHPDRVVEICDLINDIALVAGDPANSDPATRYNGNRQSTTAQNIIRQTIRFLTSIGQASRAWEPDHTGAGELVYGGTASTHVAASYDAVQNRPHRGAVSGPHGYRNMPNGAWVEIPLPVDYPGSAVAPVAVLFSAIYNTTAGSIVSSGTGVPSKSVDISRTSADSWATNPAIMRFTGNDLAPGAKTIRITVTGLTGTAARFQRFWIESDEPPDVIFYETPLMNPTPNGFLFPQSSVSDFNLYNGHAQTIVGGEFGPLSQYVPLPVLSGDYSGAASTDRNIYFTDSMHQTELGTAEYVVAGYSALTGEPVSDKLRLRARKARATVKDFRCELGLSANFAMTSGTVYAVPWDVERIDTAGLHADTSNLSRLTAIVEASWDAVFSGAIEEGNAGTGVRLIWLRLTRVDGSQRQIAGQNLEVQGTSSFFPPSGQTCWTVDMRPGDYLECLTTQNSGVAKNFLAALANVTFNIRSEI